LRRTVDRRVRQAEGEVALLSAVESLLRMAGTGAALRRRWSDMATEEQRRILHAPLDRVVVLAAQPPRQVFRPARLHPVWVELS
jgi:site-specific DNA recombinase